MSIFERIANIFSGTKPSKRQLFLDAFNENYHRLLARYDAAETTRTNAKYWSRTDALSANAAASPKIRKILRERSRYEIANNSYASGLLLTLTNDMIGTGPKLQLLHPDPQISRYVEDSFYAWSCEVGLVDMLTMLKMSYERDGESFAIMSTNRRVEHAVKLDFKVIEADQCTTPYLSPFEENEIDGIEFDHFDDPVSYNFLKYHPGDVGYNLANAFGEYEKYPARQVLHYFKPLRPGQLRGLPPGLSTLELFAQLRRATLAVMRAFEIAAMVAGVIETSLPNLEFDEVDTGELTNLTPGALITLPAGYKMSQLKAEQPVTTYKMFKDEILCEIGRCRNVPYNVIACRSDGYNYASGRLDFQIYSRTIRIEQFRMGVSIVNRIFNEWAKEAMEVDPDLWGVDLRNTRRQWYWDGSEHVDPVKEAQAQEIKLRNNLTTLALEWSKSPTGNDWERMIEQRAKEVERLKELGIASETPQEMPILKEEPETEGDENGEERESGGGGVEF
ncbi:MAG: phage portal protein [Planctomycetaceae bacterium]|jgi:lambda family phage portal protein|nr:phage portal protein [Planctomycetaceae bacterium]